MTVYPSHKELWQHTSLFESNTRSQW